MSPVISEVLKYFPLYQSKNTVKEIYRKDESQKFHLIHCDLIGLYNKVSELFIVTHFYNHTENQNDINLFIVAKQKRLFGVKWFAINITNNQFANGRTNIDDNTFRDYLKSNFEVLATAIPFTKMPTITTLNKFTKKMKEYVYPTLDSADWDKNNNYSFSIPDDLTDNDKADSNAIANIYSHLCINSIFSTTLLRGAYDLPLLPLEIATRPIKIKTKPFPYHYIPCSNGDYIYFLDTFHSPEIITSNNIISSFSQIKDDEHIYYPYLGWRLLVNEAVKQKYISRGNQLLRENFLDNLLSIRRSIIRFQQDNIKEEIMAFFEILENNINQRNANIERLIEDKKGIEVI